MTNNNDYTMDDEPPCACRQLDVDQFDARGCEYHDPGSEWNRERDRRNELENSFGHGPFRDGLVRDELSRSLAVAELAKVEAQEVYQRPAPEDVEYEYGRDMEWWL